MLLLRRQVIAIAAPCEYFEVAGVRMLASACKTLASRLHKSGSSSIQDTNLDNESKGGGSHAGELAARLRSAHRRAVGRGPLCGRGPRRRHGASFSALVAQSNLANSYGALGRGEEALRLKRDVYSGRLELNGEEHEKTLLVANNYAASLKELGRFEEARSLLRKTIPVARRVLGEGDRLTLKMRMIYAKALYKDDAATLDDLREAVTTLVETERTARRVLGGAHPVTTGIEGALRDARAALRARETPSGSA